MKGTIKAIIGTAVLASLVTACGKPPSNSSNLESDSYSSTGIIGGSQVSATDPIARSTVVVYDMKQGALCTGTVLSSQLVLTAGHCVIGSTAGSLVVVFTTNFDTAKSSDARPVTGAKVTANYINLIKKLNSDPTLNFDSIKDQGDVAVIRFSGGLPAGYQPMPVVSNVSDLANGQATILAGYGLADGVAKTGDGLLRQVQVVLKDVKFAKTEVLFDQRGHKGACHGDSGGPALALIKGQLRVYGVTSRGLNDPKNDCSHDAVYTSVPAQLPFINSAAQALTGKTLL